MKDPKNYLKDLAKMKQSKLALRLFIVDLIDFIDETTLIDFIHYKVTRKSKKTIDNKEQL